MINKIKKLKEKLTEASVNFQEIKSQGTNTEIRLVFEVLAGREINECNIYYKDEYLDELLNSEFEKFRFIHGYEAIWSKEKRTIEAEINISRNHLSRLNTYLNKPEKEDILGNNDELIKIPLPSFQDLDISLEYNSAEFLILSNAREQSLRKNIRKITLKIKNSNIETHDEAKDVLEKIANSLFFQIDLSFEIPINLESHRENLKNRLEKIRRKRLLIDESAIITEPKYEYDIEPISLYWFAKQPNQMPSFQYLAFYQAIEFYFSICSNFDAKQKVQGIIKDPRFNPNKDSEIAKIISTIQNISGNKSFGNERDQLKATISYCTNNEELREFFILDNKRFKFYEDNISKVLSKQKISVKNEKADYITEISERIYEIRCRIVHSKASEGAFETLLPYSSELKKLNYDIELIEFIARKILVATSKPIKIK